MTEAYGPKVARGKFERCSLGYLMMTCCLLVQRCALLQVVHNWTVATTHSAPTTRALSPAHSKAAARSHANGIQRHYLHTMTHARPNLGSPGGCLSRANGKTEMDAGVVTTTSSCSARLRRPKYEDVVSATRLSYER
jgi:hypothetical protein